ncbi:hypothetical protein CYY_003033 [Polysphondylium violaceum]|uniref:Uncharacterized protein n=1 Tax=Polysphondylium violaceum TaxID=133409 RepID=A0A8J4V0H1_9MYCE|nr:hypothetical protein CYY_003033 [Polysphondylium violaceum]
MISRLGSTSRLQNIIKQSLIHRSTTCLYNRRYTINSNNSITETPTTDNKDIKEIVKEKAKQVPSLNEFLVRTAKEQEVIEKQKLESLGGQYEIPPYLQSTLSNDTGEGRSVFIESYGCQMNFADTEVINSIMRSAGYTLASSYKEADIIFLNTCAIRDNAESKIWLRLSELRMHKRKNRKYNKLIVGVLGCMAERLKQKLLESDMKVDIVVGPDAYRSLPSLLAKISDGESQTAINVMLSADETYADITPVRTSDNQVSAYVSIMRGCNNMCSYCIVPFTRGRERSRPLESILNEVRQLSQQGFKEITLLGQNVNSYNYIPEEEEESAQQEQERLKPREGFNTIYKSPKKGITFTQLIDKVAEIDPEMRVRFTSPHPKDFPDDLIDIIKKRPNICKQLHMPAQSGNSNVLKNMRRGYTRESYIELIDQVKKQIPDIAISSDFISGFCGETEEEHLDTISLLEYVGYENAFMFMYSLREKTHAHRTMKDDVSVPDKTRRLTAVVDTFYRVAKEKNQKEIGRYHLVLVDRKSRRSDKDFVGRTDTNKKVIIADTPISNPSTGEQDQPIAIGDYIIVQIMEGSEITLKGKPIMKSSIQHFTTFNINDHSHLNKHQSLIN